MNGLLKIINNEHGWVEYDPNPSVYLIYIVLIVGLMQLLIWIAG